MQGFIYCLWTSILKLFCSTGIPTMLTGPVYSCTISTPCEDALHCCFYRHWLTMMWTLSICQLSKYPLAHLHSCFNGWSTSHFDFILFYFKLKYFVLCLYFSIYVVLSNRKGSLCETLQLKRGGCGGGGWGSLCTPILEGGSELHRNWPPFLTVLISIRHHFMAHWPPLSDDKNLVTKIIEPIGG